MNAHIAGCIEQTIYSWATFLWFSSFHNDGSAMMTNKQNMLLELIGLLLFVRQKDVTQPRCATSKCNEHTFAMYRMILWEFNMEQLICIVQKSLIRLGAIFESDLVASRSMGFKEYQGLFPDYLAALRVKKSNYDDDGKVEININNPVVGQLWDEVMGLLAFIRSAMFPFIKVFGVVEGHGLSPFAVKINTLQDLRQIII